MTEVTLVRSRRGAILRCTSGNFLEMFNFFLFGFYAPFISKTFFPAGDELTSLMLAFTTFWLGALMRPVGALVLGAYLDQVGRRKGLIVALALMGLGTALIAVAPSYAAVGVAGPLIVLLGGICQGLSAGVELGGVSIYLFEIATPGNKGFYTSFQSASQQVSIFTAAAIGYVLNETLSTQAIEAWGWRIPFAIGCALMPVIFYLTVGLEETPAFRAHKKHPSTKEIFSSMLTNWRIVILGVMLVSMTTVTFYFITVYTPTFGRSVLKLSGVDSLLVTLCVAATNFFWLPVGGALSDRIGRRAVLLAIAFLALCTAYPALSWLVNAPTFAKLLAVELLLSFYFGMYNGAMVVSLSEIVPPHVRTTCFSLAFALAVALFGTCTPLLSTWLITTTGDRASPGYWLMAAAACGFLATLMIYRDKEVLNAWRVRA